MSMLDKLELQLNGVLNKKTPITVPVRIRKDIANALWWIALIVGVLQLWSATVLWHVGHIVNQVINYANGQTIYSATITVKPLGLFYWLSLWVLIIDAVLLLLAAPQLKQMKRAGWRFLYYSALLNALYALCRLFSNVGGGFPGFVWTILATTLGAFFLFQVRSYFIHEETDHVKHSQEHEEHHGHEKADK